MVLSLIYMSYIYYHDWEVITYPSSPFQKGMRKWTYSSISRSFLQEFKHALGLGGEATLTRPGVRFDVLHDGYRDLTYQVSLSTHFKTRSYDTICKFSMNTENKMEWQETEHLFVLPYHDKRTQITFCYFVSYEGKHVL